jgi:hypothetical protein
MQCASSIAKRVTFHARSSAIVFGSAARSGAM